jgi:peptide-methionine (S)-S-oxide reductase
MTEHTPQNSEHGEAIFAGGCFWCVEAIFQRVRGVVETNPGYIWMLMGLPAKEDIGKLGSNRIEAVWLKWRREEVSLENLMDIFYETSSPTLVGWETQEAFSHVRSGLFFPIKEDQEIAEQHLERLKGSGRYGEDAVQTQIGAMPAFEQAPESDRSFYLKDPQDAFCRGIVTPKLARLQTKFADACRGN